MQNKILKCIGSMLMFGVVTVASLFQGLPAIVYAAENIQTTNVDYSVTLVDTGHGKIRFTDTDDAKKNINPGDVVVLQAIPDEGYMLSRAVAVADDVVTTEYTHKNITFVMPKANVKVYGEFVKGDGSERALDANVIELGAVDADTSVIYDVDGNPLHALRFGGLTDISSVVPGLTWGENSIPNIDGRGITRISYSGNGYLFSNSVSSGRDIGTARIVDNHGNAWLCLNAGLYGPENEVSGTRFTLHRVEDPALNALALHGVQNISTTEAYARVWATAQYYYAEHDFYVGGRQLGPYLVGNKSRRNDASYGVGSRMEKHIDRDLYNKMVQGEPDHFVYVLVPDNSEVQLLVQYGGRVERLGDFKVTKTFDASKGGAYHKTATFEMIPQGISGQGTVRKSVTGNQTILFEGLKAGRYELREVAVGGGYTAAAPQIVQVIAGRKGDAAPGITLNNVAQKTSFSLEKMSAKESLSKNNRNYSLAGAEFTLTMTDDNSVSYTLRTDERGQASVQNIWLGEYELTETKAPQGYAITFNAEEIDVVANGLQKRVQDHPRYDPVQLELRKQDAELAALDPTRMHPQGDGSLVGAVFRVDYYVEQDLTEAQIRAGQGTKKFSVDLTSRLVDGQARVYMQRDFMSNWQHIDGFTLDDMWIGNQFAIPYGTFTITEITAPKGYTTEGVLLDGKSMFVRNIKSDANVIDRITNIMVSQPTNANIIAKERSIYEDGSIEIEKRDVQFNTTTPQGDGVIEVYYDVVNASENAIVYDGRIVEVGEVIKRIASDPTTKRAKIEGLPVGTYTLREVLSHTSYNTEPNVRTVKLTPEQKDVRLLSDGQVAVNSVKRGGVKVRKVDADMTAVQGDATLEGAEYTIINKSQNAVVSGITGQTVAVDGVVGTIRTNVNGEAFTDLDALPYGTYEIYESQAPRGYQLNTTWRKTFTIREPEIGTYVNFTQPPVNADSTDNEKTANADHVVRGDVRVEKWDKELGRSEAIAGRDHKGGEKGDGSHLNGLAFEIKNVSRQPVVVDGVQYAVGEVVKTIYTEWNAEIGKYTAETKNQTLPYGTYEIREVGDNLAYKAIDKSVFTFEIRNQGEIVTNHVNGGLMHFINEIRRGDFEFVKIIDGNSARLSTLWTLTNKTSGEIHVIATDQNGEFYSDGDSGYAHSLNTNVNDKFLPAIQAGEIIKMKDVELRAGVWFGLGEDGNMAPVNDNLRALPYGEYELKEVDTDTNQGLKLQKFTFWIFRDNKVVNGGTITNDRIPPEIRTKAVDSVTNDHIGLAKERVVVKDTVFYKGLLVGREHTVSGVLMNKETGTPLLVNGQKVTAEKTFTVENSPGEVELEFVIEDGSVLRGKTVVVFEDVFEGDLKVGTHADINDEEQSVYYPEIKTSVADNETKDRVTAVGGTRTFIDTVAYKNLIVGREYRVNGKLMDKETSAPLLVNGQEVTGSTIFTAEQPNGSVEIRFEVDTTALAGKRLVVFEDVYVNDKLVGIHADIEDLGQTIEIPQIRTKARSELTGNEIVPAIGKQRIVDKVMFKNLVVGKTYTIKGTLMNKATKQAVGGAVAEKTFVAETRDGFVELFFEVDAKELQGSTLVAFERLEYNGIELTVHADIDDADQTVYIPEIGTKAKAESTLTQTGSSEQKEKLIDTVNYKNLVVGKKYTVVATLMDKASETPIEGATASVEVTPTTSDGSVDVEIEVDGKVLRGKTVVFFEDMQHDGRSIAIHADINDDGQSVNFPEIGTQAHDSATTTQQLALDKEVKIVDKVAYRKLRVGGKYTINGTLMDKETKQPFLVNGEPVKSTLEFTPETEDGTVLIEFVLKEADLVGKTLVVFEDVKQGEISVAVHADIEDEAQTVYGMKIGTTATAGDKQSKEIEYGDNVTVVDKVAYENAVVGQKYVAEGTLRDASNGNALKMVDGKDAVVRVEFVADKVNGEVFVPFVVNTKEFAGKNLVVTEDVFSENGTLVARHYDLKDEGQTVKVKEKPPVPPTPPTTPYTPKTGVADTAVTVGYVALGLTVVAVVTLVVTRRKVM